jgi:hypothetical protein
MTAEQFTYWLQGFIEINDPETLGVRETQIIKDHLASVFNKQTPDRLTTIPNKGIAQPYPGPMTTGPYTSPNQPLTGWDWDLPKNPYTVTCGNDNPFNDKFDATSETLRPANVYNTSTNRNQFTTSTSKLIC